MTRTLLLLSYVVTFALAAACGDDDDVDEGDTSTVSTGLPRNEELSGLDEDDLVQVCSATARAFNRVLPESQMERMACTFEAMTLIVGESDGESSSADIEQCEDITSQCLDGEVGGEPVSLDTDFIDADTCDGEVARANLTDCDATVEEYERCAGRFASLLRGELTAIRCDVLADFEDVMEALTIEVDYGDEADCNALVTKCPELGFLEDAAE